MKIRMLGTGYGECKIKKKISKDYRKCGGIIINDSLLIDATEGMFEVADELGLSDIFDEVSNVLISHSHQGHFSPEAILRLAQKKRVRVLATQSVLELIPECENVIPQPILPFTKYSLGSFTVIPLPANHFTERQNELCLNFLILGDKNLFCALDGGFIRCDVFEALKQIQLDAVILECALELLPPSEKLLYHNDLLANERIKGMLEDAKIASDKTKFILTHIPSSKKRSIHDELCEAVIGKRMIVSYDGYYLTV